MNLLLVDDDAVFRDAFVRWMHFKGHHVTAVSSGAEAISQCEKHDFDIAVFDLNMPGMSGLELLQRVRSLSTIEVVILTGQGTIESAVSAMKLGAFGYLTKPCAMGDLEERCLAALEHRQLQLDRKAPKPVPLRRRPALTMIGNSPSMREVVRLIHRIAPTDKPVLIQGASGTGKEVVARAVQQNSDLSDQPFVTINCAALPDLLVESELFGHQKGAFTGATTDKPGLFEIADGGTLFIDEIGELPLALQPKLLRVLEDGSMRRIGGHQERIVRVRIIVATNRDLAAEVQAGNFREDLYYRINVLSIHLPPLCQRTGDIDRLVDHFLPHPWTIEASAREALNRFDWPGNVRQLSNVLQRATVLADANMITLDDLPAEIAGRASAVRSEVHETARPRFNINDQDNESIALDDISKAHVLDVLAKENGNKASAARKLGIHRRKLYRLLERYQSNDNSAQMTS
ncbi:Transcriptional regulatory protein ZraR [Rosistilla carotiformis]|uniref:Transcriptional regulatory protein ZraR n=2 Tax=Rosistilla carotiformis TaxID=2528017 RepID=A0A518JPT5_9BACT|nr:Transcriptional regulatory protein ZraR [Rosistilla carotiformis]